jgi:hypothetical protein
MPIDRGPLRWLAVAALGAALAGGLPARAQSTGRQPPESPAGTQAGAPQPAAAASPGAAAPAGQRGAGGSQPAAGAKSAGGGAAPPSPAGATTGAEVKPGAPWGREILPPWVAEAAALTGLATLAVATITLLALFGNAARHGYAIEVETHWGGFGGGLGRWRMSAPLVYLLAAMLFGCLLSLLVLRLIAAAKPPAAGSETSGRTAVTESGGTAEKSTPAAGSGVIQGGGAAAR